MCSIGTWRGYKCYRKYLQARRCLCQKGTGKSGAYRDKYGEMSDGRMLPVRTKTDIPKAKVLECVRELKYVVVEAPVETGR